VLDGDTRAALTEHLKLLRRPVRLRFRADNQEASRLAHDLADLSPLIAVEPGTTADLEVIGEHPGPRFVGMPGGHEFTSFVLAVLHAGGHPAKEGADAMRKAAETVDRCDVELEFVTYYSQSCMNCPQVVQALNLLSVLSPRVRATAVDIAAAREDVERRGISAVPAVYLNDQPFVVGRVDAETLAVHIAEKLGAEQDATEDAKKTESRVVDLLVVGGGPAGTAAAVYAARKGLSVAVLSETWGGQLLDTEGIENLITGGPTTGRALARQLQENLDNNHVDRVHGRAEKLQPGRTRRWAVRTNNVTHEAETVLLAPGASWRTLGVPGEDTYRNRGVTFCPHCDGPLFNGKDIAVIGGGNSGLEAALDLSGTSRNVTVIEYGEHCKADRVLLDALARRANARIITNSETTAIIGDGTRVTAIALRDRRDGSTSELAVDGVFVQIGLLPNTGWLVGDVATNNLGEIITDGSGRTDRAGVYAAGDASDGARKQITTAVGEGAAAAITLFEDLAVQR